MPSKDDLKFIKGQQVTDLRNVRLPGLNKPFEQLTISELVQLRPGSDVADTYEVNAVTDNISATTSAALEALGRVHKEKVMDQVVNQVRLNDLRETLGTRIGVVNESVSGFSADQPRRGEVSLPPADSDAFKASSVDPFKA